MPSAAFEFKITGENVSPETVQWRDLSVAVSALEKALLATLNLRPSDNIEFSLSNIRPSSAALKITAGDPLVKAAVMLSTILSSGNAEVLPPPARKAVGVLGKMAKEHNWAFSFAGNPQLRIKEAFITAEHADIESAIITGQTTILGRIVRVGGEHAPTAQLQLLGENAGSVTISLPNKDFAKKLGDNLYAIRTLHGIATWNGKTRKLESFKAEKIGEYLETESIPQDPLCTLEKISQIAPGHWDQIDPDTYVSDQRTD